MFFPIPDNNHHNKHLQKYRSLHSFEQQQLIENVSQQLQINNESQKDAHHDNEKQLSQYNIKYEQNIQKNITWMSFVLLIVLVLLICLFLYQTHIHTLINSERQYENKLINKYPQISRNIMWLKTYKYINDKNTQKQKQNISNNINKQVKLSQYIKNATQYLQQPKLYSYIQQTQFKLQLPFCIIINQRNIKYRIKILSSIINNNYTNYKIIIIVNSKDNTQFINDDKINIIKMDKIDYFYNKQLINNKCERNSLLFFVNHPIKQQALMKLNNYHQLWNTWLIYDIKNQALQIYTFYSRIYDLLENNDFLGTNKIYLKTNNKQIQALSLLELCKKYSKKLIDSSQIFEQRNSNTYFTVNINSNYMTHRTKYQTLTRLSQDFEILVDKDQQNYQRMLIKSQNYAKQYKQIYNMSRNKMQFAIQLQNLIYLPYNHSLAKKQQLYYNKIYEINKFKNNQLPFCLTILSHNNIQNNRYIKNLLSIFQQQYNNYHIVFIDDLSDDNTFNKTMQFVKKYGFDKNKIKYVKNLQRKFATYNILNAAFNFCGQDQIQILIDGDDQIIGRHAFNLINSVYHKNNEPWIVYTNLKTNLYEFGMSKPAVETKRFINNQNMRVKGHFLGQIRSWKVKLIRSIPKKYHQSQNNKWLDTVYDDALQHPLFEIARQKHIQYIPQICYQYNREYGDNDDSNLQKIQHRINTYNYLISLTPLEKVESINDVKQNEEMLSIFNNGKQKETYQVFQN